jgi:hypothetical protein
MSMTRGVQQKLSATLPYEELLPYEQPAYVHSYVYLFGIAALAILTVSILTMILTFLPWIPGLNRVPRYLKVYRLIWKDYYREQRDAAASMPQKSEPPRIPVEV